MVKPSDLQKIIALTNETLKECFGSKKAREITQKVADKWAQSKYIDAKTRWENRVPINSPEEFAVAATESHDAHFGKDVFIMKVAEGKIVGTAKQEYCRFGELVKGQPLLCEYCLALWNKQIKYIFPKTRKVNLSQSIANGSEKCVMTVEY